jgi:hypothetical protein
MKLWQNEAIHAGQRTHLENIDMNRGLVKGELRQCRPIVPVDEAFRRLREVERRTES